MTIKLRPHHLLCTQSYMGKGYSEEFVKNMDRIVRQLAEEEAAEVAIVFSTDDLCAHCPNMCGTDCCIDQVKVKEYDRRVTEAFCLEQKKYVYRELIQKMGRQLTPELLDTICGTCSWYRDSACKEIILRKVEQS